ncbi:MAG: hypothetical protein HY201_05440 [Nitrospirae bacterium]|nr:hypothetical protein [Candidatus Troglogloeales bacterium]MBI3598869.1 hypothetical protein [Candidatus Troglogloeales bacterium]
MDFRNLPQEYRVISSKRGVALFTSMMLLVLVSGLALFILQNATTEMQISNESSEAVVHAYQAESGIEQALAWFNDPAKSPKDLQKFFAKPKCEGKFKNQDKPFASLVEDLGETITFRFYNTPKTPKQQGLCTVEVTTSSGKAVTIDLSPNPMPPMKEEISTSTTEMEPIKRFAKRFGRYFIVSPEGTLEENKKDVGTFNTVFSDGKVSDRPIFIDVVEGYSSRDPLQIGNGSYKGYFYFSGDIEIEGAFGGQTIEIVDNVKPDKFDLSGFFYTWGKMIIDGQFLVDGAVCAGLGVEENADSQLLVWYNENYSSGTYEGVLPLIPKYHPPKGK